jgi:2-keto-4-pentenoate hydratase/2-oxohepta-3-ene-1,7-dioic acid hydratase in catechol pathway
MSSCRELGFRELVEAPFPFARRDPGIARLWHSRWRDGSYPIGPWIVPSDAVDFHDVHARLSVEGVGRTERTGQEAYDAPYTLSRITPLFGLEAGDVIGLGALADELVLDAPLPKIASAVAEVEGIGRLEYFIDTSRWDPDARYQPKYRPHIADALTDRRRHQK